MYWDHMTGWGWLMMVLWSLLWIGLLGVLFWAVVQWARGGSASAPSRHPPAGAREILDERLARGEISVDEYHRLRGALDQ